MGADQDTGKTGNESISGHTRLSYRRAIALFTLASGGLPRFFPLSNNHDRPRSFRDDQLERPYLAAHRSYRIPGPTITAV